MKIDTVFLVVAGLFILFFVIIAFAQDIAWEDIGRGNSDINTVLINPDNPSIIYIGSKNGIFKSQDAGLSWRNVLSLRGGNKSVNFLLFDSQDKNSLYAATGNGLFYSPNQGKTWNRIFKGKSFLESECTVLMVLPYAIYLGTKAGLFVTTDKGRSWYKQTQELGKSHILSIAYHLKEQDHIYVVCIEGVFKAKNRGETWEEIFIASPTENNGDDEQDLDDQDQEKQFSNLRYITIDPHNLNELYLATAKGVYKSKDGGQSWSLMTDYGLLNREVNFLLLSDKSHLYAVTKSGIFEYRDERWHELSFGLVTEKINSLSIDNQGNLYAACDKGLFRRSEESYSNNGKTNAIDLYLKDEPPINAVRQAAIKYAEVEPDKIKHWRRQAAKKAWLPDVSVGVNRDTSDLWHWESGSTTKSGDDILIRGRDIIEWDVSLSWDLGELIWNDDQTSIDVRSRLMVQLRDDILDEATKLYFERIRVKMELDNLSIEDRKKRFEKELRLQELTASLDALTGGYFSHPIKNSP